MTFWSNHGYLELHIGEVAFRNFLSGLEVLLCINILIRIAHYPQPPHWGWFEMEYADRTPPGGGWFEISGNGMNNGFNTLEPPGAGPRKRG